MNDKYIIYFLSKTKKIMQQHIASRLLEEGITDIVPSHGNIFTILYDNEGSLSMKEIASKVGKDKSTITSHVKHLVKCGYLKKTTSEVDKRIQIISLTDKGWKFQKTYQLISNEVYEKTYSNMNEQQKEDFLETLKMIYTNFK